ncbi:MAG: hypothetical protein IKX76_04335 [Eubacterium sp.]|nr:hypothetical protein [Eubacterium sp.]
MMRLLQRILAILGVAALLGLVFLTLYLAVTGSPYFMASLFAMIVIPVFIYGYMTILRILSKDQKKRIEDILEEGSGGSDQAAGREETKE